MDMDLLVAAAAANYSICMAAVALSRPVKTKKIKAEKRRRTCWIKPCRETRQYYSDVDIIFKEYALSVENESGKTYTLMDEICFNELLEYIKSDITRLDTPLRKSVPAAEKLAATLRYLTTDENMTTLANTMNLSVAFLTQAIIEVCESLYKNLKTKFMRFPTSKEEWLEIAKEFEQKFNFPNCLGVLNAKHAEFLAARAEKLSGVYCNADGLQSVILLAMVDASGKFTFINIGKNGNSDFNTALQSSDLMKVLKQAENQIPEARTMSNDSELPYVILANNNFEDLDHILTPYEGIKLTRNDRIFNSRHAETWKHIGDIFATVHQNFKAMDKIPSLGKSKMVKISQCIYVLHNYLIERKSKWYQRRVQDSQYKTSSKRSDNFETQKVDIVREAFKDYFVKENPENDI